MLVSSFGRYVILAARSAVWSWGFLWLGAVVSGLANVHAQYHNEGVLKKYGAKLKVGSVKEEAKL